MSKPTPIWIAQRHGQDWQSSEVLLAIEWLTSTVDRTVWSARLERVRRTFEIAKQSLVSGDKVVLYDPTDLIAWYIFQADAYARSRKDWYEPEAFRIAPLFWRLGQIIRDLQMVPGAIERAYHLMVDPKSQPDEVLYELLVAGAYKRHSPHEVAFVAARPGVAKTFDLLITTPEGCWGAECKRVSTSDYEVNESNVANELARAVHYLCRARSKSLVVDVTFKIELSEIELDYLATRVERFLDNEHLDRWDDTSGIGTVRSVDWTALHAVLDHDQVFFNSSRMVELVRGALEPGYDYVIDTQGSAAPDRPFHATKVFQACVVGWRSSSEKAARRKARHFRTTIARATEQLSDEFPGVIHVGYESFGANSVDERRHWRNSEEIKSFDPGSKDLRVIYANYFSPEHTNNKNESLAVSETTATFPIGFRGGAELLHGHMLFDDMTGDPGDHW